MLPVKSLFVKLSKDLPRCFKCCYRNIFRNIIVIPQSVVLSVFLRSFWLFGFLLLHLQLVAEVLVGLYGAKQGT